MSILTINHGYSGPNESLTGSVTVSCDTVWAGDVTVAAGKTNQEYDIDLVASQMKVVFVKAVGAALTVKTNSTSAPDNTLTLASGESIAWANGLESSNPFTANLTKIYVTNPGSDSGTLNIRIGSVNQV